MAEERPDKKGDGSELSDTARAMQGAMPWVGAVWKFVGGTAVGVIAGYFLDRWLGTTPWLLLGLALLGTGVGFYGFIHDVTKLGKKR
ncbi:MAG: AtpZ/AtpI family protein [Myxococcaceae bacterium]|nr:AtpZ/AtpI family protein [Myxococcaceae bacterium]